MSMRIAEQVDAAFDPNTSKEVLMRIAARGSKRAARIVSERFGLPRREDDLGQHIDILNVLDERGLTDLRQKTFLRACDPQASEQELLAVFEEWGDFKHEIYPCVLRAVLEHQNLGPHRVDEIRRAMEEARVSWWIGQGWKGEGLPPHMTKPHPSRWRREIKVDRWISEEASA